MPPMIEHVFEQSKFVAEFPSAAQNPILRNALCNVHSTISPRLLMSQGRMIGKTWAACMAWV